MIRSGSTFEAEIGSSRAVVDGEWVFVPGTTGFDYRTMTIAEGIAEQTEQCLRNVESALREAGATLADVVRVTSVVPKGEEFPTCWPVLPMLRLLSAPEAMGFYERVGLEAVADGWMIKRAKESPAEAGASRRRSGGRARDNGPA